MKISKYITKYDYIAYYTKQKSLWFFTNAEIQAGISVEKEQLMKLNNHFLYTDDELEEFNDNDSTLDSLSLLRSEDMYNEMIIDDYKDNDSLLLENFKDKLKQLKDVDELNPLIIQGRILDEESKKFIINQFNKLNDFKVFDFDNHKFNLEKAELETQKLLLNNNKIIIFQPVFIDYKRKIVTKCDALIKINNEIKVIETKGTTNLKKAHFLDIYYQKRLLDEIEYLNQNHFEISFSLCCVKYEKLNKNQVSFIISDYLNFTKTGFSKSKNKEYSIDELMMLKIGNKENGTSIEDLLKNQIVVNNKKSLEISEELKQLEIDFDKVINELWTHKKSMDQCSIPKNFIPSKEDKSNFKDTDVWMDLKHIYILKKYNPFNFSGNITNHIKLCQHQYNKINEPIINFKSYFKKKYDEFQDLFILQKNDLKFNVAKPEKLQQTLNNLKNKKVYFDFETINSAIRPIDNIFPFTQIVTQCSIIKDHGSGIENEKCNNLMADPLNLNSSWWKKIVDDLYETDEYSYVVYNKSFEKARLQEIKNYINDVEYHKKIDCIINNLFDLADFFDLNKEIFIIYELFGLYSIKKVLPLIQKYAPELFEQTKCLDYKTLEIGNGLVCQNKSTCRFLNKINDEQWEKIKLDSKIYCENDVRAMVAVEKFITDYLVVLINKKES